MLFWLTMANLYISYYLVRNGLIIFGQPNSLMIIFGGCAFAALAAVSTAFGFWQHQLTRHLL